MTIEQLSALLANKEFHHATYRNVGRLNEGLYIYKKDPDGFRGYRPAGAFFKWYLDTTEERLNPALPLAEEMLRHLNIGVSVGAYGEG